MLKDKSIIILSPQPWSHLNISKHHYARELAIHNKVFFVTSPEEKIGLSFNWRKPEIGNLEVLTFQVPVFHVFRFYLKKSYSTIAKWRLLYILKKKSGMVDICIDFGYYSELRSLNKILAKKKIYFPVDDVNLQEPNSRDADLVLSVSPILVERFIGAGIPCYFINHGLSLPFVKPALNQMSLCWQRKSTIKIVYAGYLFIKYIDIPVFKKIVNKFPEIHFHFYGSMEYNPDSKTHKDWFDFLHGKENVFLHGVVSTESLSIAYSEADGFLLCYKPDFINYHGENSHKILEYLSSGKVLISTYISLYEESDLIAMSPKARNEELVDLFGSVLENLENYNSIELIKRRISLALDNTYEKQILKISGFLEKTE